MVKGLINSGLFFLNLHYKKGSCTNLGQNALAPVGLNGKRGFFAHAELAYFLSRILVT